MANSSDLSAVKASRSGWVRMKSRSSTGTRPLSCSPRGERIPVPNTSRSPRGGGPLASGPRQRMAEDERPVALRHAVPRLLDPLDSTRRPSDLYGHVAPISTRIRCWCVVTWSAVRLRRGLLTHRLFAVTARGNLSSGASLTEKRMASSEAVGFASDARPRPARQRCRPAPVEALAVHHACASALHHVVDDGTRVAMGVGRLAGRQELQRTMDRGEGAATGQRIRYSSR